MAFQPTIQEGIKRLTIYDLDHRLKESLDYFHTHEENNDLGGMDACLSCLVRELSSESLMKFYRDGDLRSCKNYAFNAAMSHRLLCQLRPAKDGEAKVLGPLFFTLLSGHEGLIHWYTQYRLPLYIEINEPMPRHENPIRYEFFSLQVLLALAGEFESLKLRSEYYLNNLPSKWQRKQDYQFFIALAEADKDKMTEALLALLKPQVARHRIEDVWGLQKEFIHSWVFIYLKIALIHGYDLDIDSWIPKELLALEPLDKYESFFDLWDESLIFQTFEDRAQSWCPVASKLSPKPLGEPILTLEQQINILKENGVLKR